MTTTRQKTAYARIEFRDLTPGSSYPDWQTYTEDSMPADAVDDWVKELAGCDRFDGWREYRLFVHPEKRFVKEGPWSYSCRIEYGPAELIRDWKGVPS